MQSLKERIKSRAYDLGFNYCGFSKADFLAEEAPKLEKWLNSNYQGKMNYMNNHFDKRLDPRKLMNGCKTVISFIINYYSNSKQEDANAPKLSKYAYGQDYHYVIKEKLRKLVAFIEDNVGDVTTKICVDSAPVMDKVWAKKSGLGWIGKHTNLIRPKMGSYFFLAEILIDYDFQYDEPMKDYCGDCTRCIDACPTEAIVEPYLLDAKKCISYLTIELKDEIIPSEFKGKMDNWMFGCDVCQEVCPWNRFSLKHQIEEFEPKNELLSLSSNEWYNLEKETFDKLFRLSAVKRTKYKGLKRNIRFLEPET
jgi:epoxyqueuosine reductase